MMIKNGGLLALVLLGMLLLVGCAGADAPAQNKSSAGEATQTAKPTLDLDWFSMEMTDVTTGETFTMNDFAGKVVILDTMAMWCPGCLTQAKEISKMLETIGNPEDLVVVSLDVDTKEDADTLKKYVEENNLSWHYSVAPLLVARALGNLYTAQYLNPPISPMMLIDRDGKVHHLQYGTKSAESLQKFIKPFLEK